uniref:Uncharacterized protein n=1 Tax=Globisporangium ultimum (strain ATCC 200006 / CBS 805.95 / DAOM BR144) TaxID=431595 RepID=K3X5R5_GLOUD
MSALAPSDDDAATSAKVLELFDNEALWDADNTDEFILKLFRDLEVSGVNLVSVKDLGSNSLLHMTALWNRSVIMDELLRKGAELNEKNKNGHTPLDLAAHWGHFELASQLQHYGGKHTCECERDIAISQRDLTQQQNKECEAEMVNALQRLKQAKQEREEFRIERDRVLQLHSDVISECNLQADQLKLLQATITTITEEKHTLRIKAAQLTDELQCEQAARNNAVQGWKLAEKVIADMQQLHEECREREEEALAMRNEALQERDVARDIARQAQLDQGITKQHQTDAEKERDKALKTLMDTESELARDKELWRSRIAKIELDRRNIQIEIDRQTEILRSENSKLSKQVVGLTAMSSRLREELDETKIALANVQKQHQVQQRQLNSATDRVTELEKQVQTLLDERRDEYRRWRHKIEHNLQQTIASELKSMLEASVAAWRKLHECQEQILAFDMTSLSAIFHVSSSSSLDLSPESELPIALRPNTVTASIPSPRHVVLPFLQDKSTGLKESLSTPRMPTAVAAPGNNVPNIMNLHCVSQSIRKLPFD